jgi:hypothetical protein
MRDESCICPECGKRECACINWVQCPVCGAAGSADEPCLCPPEWQDRNGKNVMIGGFNEESET